MRCSDFKDKIEHVTHWHVVMAGNIVFAGGQCPGYRKETEVSKSIKKYKPGTVLCDAAGNYWLVRDDGRAAYGTNGGVMVDLTRGKPVYEPDKK